MIQIAGTLLAVLFIILFMSFGQKKRRANARHFYSLLPQLLINITSDEASNL